MDENDPDKRNSGGDNYKPNSTKPPDSSATEESNTEQPFHPVFDQLQERQEPSDEQRPSVDRSRRDSKPFWAQLNSREWITVGAAVGAAAAAIASVFVAYWTYSVMQQQWSTMQAQLREMRSSGNDTKNLVKATRYLATAARDQATNTGDLVKAARAQARAMDRLREAGESQAAATADLKSATQRQAKNIASLLGGMMIAANASRDQANATRDAARASAQGNEIANAAFLASERPWAGVEAIRWNAIPSVGSDFTTTITIRNTGRSPALALTGSFSASLRSGPIMEIPVLEKCAPRCSSSTVLPNGTAAYSPTLAKELLTADVIRRLADGSDSILLFGRIDYVDDAGRPHKTFFCNWWNGKIATYSSCNRGNSAD